MVVDVLTRPEPYLFFINKVLVTINSIGLFLLGVFTYRFSKNIYLSLLIQLSPFTSIEIYYGLIIVTPENFIIFVCICFIGIIIYYLYRIDIHMKQPLKFVLILGLVCGLGLASKLYFIPLIVIPLTIIKGFKNSIIFLFTFVLSFLIFISPALSHFDYFLIWVKDLFINSGKHGGGESNIINTSSFLKNVIMIFTKDYIFGLAYLFTLITLLTKKLLYKKHRDLNLKKITMVLTGIFITFTFQIIIVGKHYSQYYMLPSFMLSVLAITLSAYIFSSLITKYQTGFKLEYLTIPLIAIFASWGILQIILSYNEGDLQRKDAMEALYFVRDNYPEALVISSFGTANPQCALAFASQYGSGQSQSYRNLLSQMYSSKIFYNQWRNVFYTTFDPSDLKNTLLSSKTILVVLVSTFGSIEQFIKTFKEITQKSDVTYTQLFSNKKMEFIYELKINH
ncbi:MAG: hypothetical protein ABI840_03595, partial [bacterium]